MSPRVVAVVQARAGSSRLPAKVLLPLGDRSVLGWVTRAALAARGLDEVVVATSTNKKDNAVVEECHRIGIPFIRGSEDDVLSRFVLAADETKADVVVRLTSDCPLLDPVVVDQLVNIWRADPSLEYVSTTLYRTMPLGLDAELASVAALKQAAAFTTGHHRTHVTSSLYAASSDVRRAGIVMVPNNADLRVTLDVEADYIALKEIVSIMGDGPHPWRSVVNLLRMNPDIQRINAHVKQKEIEDG